MVCLGNICRSPLAHGIMENLAREKNLHWQIDSAGTGDWHIGSAPDHRSIAIAKKYGIDISGQACRQFSTDDFTDYDRIYVMDHSNLKDVTKLSTNQKDTDKIRLLLDQEIVPDPYWDDQLFDPVFQMIREGCERIIEEELKR
ncbi:MAG: low molecular weight protein-tyrosine-phosphatase [Ginsengibacter sp.]